MRSASKRNERDSGLDAGRGVKGVRSTRPRSRPRGELSASVGERLIGKWQHESVKTAYLVGDPWTAHLQAAR